MGSEETDQAGYRPLAKKATGMNGELLKIATTRGEKRELDPLVILRIYYPKNGSWPSRNPSTAAEGAALGPALSFAEGANGLSPNG